MKDSTMGFIGTAAIFLCQVLTVGWFVRVMEKRDGKQKTRD